MRNGNFAFLLLERAFSYGDRTAFRYSGGSLAYRRFADLAVHFARQMRDFGVGHTSHISLATKHPATTCIAVVAASLLGAQWRRNDGYNAKEGPLATTHSFSDQGSGAGAYEFTRSWFDAPPASPADLADFDGHNSPDDIWLVGTSSGTTGTSKYLPLTYRGAWARIVDGATRWADIPPVTFSHFDACGIVGIRPRLATLLVGGRNVSSIASSQFEAEGVTLVFGSPIQVLKMLETLPSDTRLRTCRITGAQVTRRLGQMVLEHFDELEVMYGAAEAGVTTIARFNRDRPYDGTVGVPVDGVSVQILDANGEVSQGDEGIVRILSSGMVNYYLEAPDLTQRFFADGWFQPGDLGYFDANGQLHITGRTSDVINISGVKLNAADFDELIQLHPGVADGYCFIDRTESGLDRLAAVVSLRQGVEAARLQDLRSFAAKRLGPARILERVYIATTVARNENGKPRRRDAVELVRDLPLIDFG